MKKKIAAGACFFQTQVNYDFEDFCSFLRLANDLEKPILAGILVLHTPDIARFINENIPGIQLPHSIIERLENAPDPEKEGIELAIHSMMQLKDYCAGFHIMTIRREPLIPLVVKGFYERLSL